MVQLARLGELLHRRRSLAARYDAALETMPYLHIPAVPLGTLHNYQSYMVRLVDGCGINRDELMQYLLDRGISTRRAIMAIHREAPYRSGDWDWRLPQTNLATDTGIILPLFHQMTGADQDHVIETLCEFAEIQ
jgi:perosamine synthetase